MRLPSLIRLHGRIAGDFGHEERRAHRTQGHGGLVPSDWLAEHHHIWAGIVGLASRAWQATQLHLLTNAPGGAAPVCLLLQHDARRAARFLVPRRAHHALLGVIQQPGWYLGDNFQVGHVFSLLDVTFWWDPPCSPLPLEGVRLLLPPARGSGDSLPPACRANYQPSARGGLFRREAGTTALFDILSQRPWGFRGNCDTLATIDGCFRFVKRGDQLSAGKLAVFPQREGFLDRLLLVLEPSAGDGLTDKILLTGNKMYLHGLSVGPSAGRVKDAARQSSGHGGEAVQAVQADGHGAGPLASTI